MPMQTGRLRNILLGGAALAVAGILSTGTAQATPVLPAMGDSVHVTSETPANYDTATINFAGLPGGSVYAYIAPELLSGTFGAFATTLNNLLAYCTDLYDYSGSPVTYTVAHLTSSHQPSGIDDLSAAQINNITALIAANRADQTATQLAIWTVEYGDAFSYTGSTATIVADVASDLAGLTGLAPANVALYQLQAANVQGFAYIGAPIPEPASLVVLGIGMLGLTAARCRRTLAARCSSRLT